VTAATWTRVMLDFTTPATEGVCAVLVAKTGDGTVFCDNLGLPRRMPTGLDERSTR